MSVDKFGRFSKRGSRGPMGERGTPGVEGMPGNGFKLTLEGDYDLDFKHLKNVKDPVHEQDATTKKYVDNEFNTMDKVFKNYQQYIDKTYHELIMKNPYEYVKTLPNGDSEKLKL